MFALLGYGVVGALVLVLVPDFAGVFLLGAYCIPANSVFPIPHEPAILFFAKYYHPVWIALAGVVGSLIACFADYAIVGAALHSRVLAGAQRSRIYRWATRWMRRFPFAITVLFSLVPLPISVVRVLAPAIDYAMPRYMLAQAIGRFPRFYALAWLGHTFHVPGWALIAIFVALLAMLVVSSRSPEEPPKPPD